MCVGVTVLTRQTSSGIEPPGFEPFGVRFLVSSLCAKFLVASEVGAASRE